MNDPKPGSASTFRTIALIAIPVIVAIAVAAFVLSARDKEGDGSAAPTTSMAVDGQPGTTTTVDPKVASFCRETETINQQMQEASERFQTDEGDVPTPDEVADLIASFDLASLDIDQTPAEMQDDLKYLIERRDAAVDEIRRAPVGTPITELLPADLLERFANIIQYHLDFCA